MASAPPMRVIKINVDVSSLNNPSNVGFGGLSKNHHGKIKLILESARR